ncbi:MAG: NUDIX domain-containing protein [Planctomycetes bacterium]|nr:NUDIX domain-containing protein [Planctomycetota bacterium]
MQRPIQLFQVALKAFIVREGRLLMLRESFGPRAWELPGGRIDVGEERVAPTDVLRRELREELGPEFQCEIGAPFATWVRDREAHRPHPAFLIGFECGAPRGALRLSAEHLELEWVSRERSGELDLAPGYASALEQFWRRFPELC